jgi:hypothetical protein
VAFVLDDTAWIFSVTNMLRWRRRIDPVGVSRLATVLETYTDVTRYPRPKRCDAAIIVAATSDAYVSTQSVSAPKPTATHFLPLSHESLSHVADLFRLLFIQVLEVQQHWPGSEIRWVRRLS